jgi:hypothetical protein
MMRQEINFTKKALTNLQPPEGKKRVYVYDHKESGLVMQVMPTGRKTFQFYKWFKKGKIAVRVTIGTFPDWTIEQARKEAQKCKPMVSTQPIRNGRPERK